MSDPEQLVYLCGGEIDEGEFSLVISSDNLDPNEITKLLGIQPTDSHQRGDFNKASKIQFNYGRWTYSTNRINFRAGKSCEENFDDFLHSLPNISEAWNQIATKHEARVFICLWMKTWNREFDFSAFAISELARRHLRVHIDTYLDLDDGINAGPE
jgi:hypothetical protein